MYSWVTFQLTGIPIILSRYLATLALLSRHNSTTQITLGGTTPDAVQMAFAALNTIDGMMPILKGL